MTVHIDDILRRVEKPARYLGGEFNSVTKDHAAIPMKVALAFPDTYEIGMSHLGLRILYHIINEREDACAERVFAPWTDMEVPKPSGLTEKRGLFHPT